MPQTAEHHRDHQVAVGGERRPSRPAQGLVEVVAQPRAERDVPAPPELLEVARDVGGVEVLGQLVPEQLRGAAERHVGVAREKLDA